MSVKLTVKYTNGWETTYDVEADLQTLRAALKTVDDSGRLYIEPNRVSALVLIPQNLASISVVESSDVR